LNARATDRAPFCKSDRLLGIVLNPVLRLIAQLQMRFWPVTWLVVRITWWLIVIRFVEIAVWALFFWRQKCLPDAESSFYFSDVNYATIGYGDLVLPKEWRLFGPVEGLNWHFDVWVVHRIFIRYFEYSSRTPKQN
jgi:hypothetical protein